MTIGHSEYTEATERSNSPAIISIVIPRPTTPNWTALARIEPADEGVRNTGETNANTEAIMSPAIRTPSSWMAKRRISTERTPRWVVGAERPAPVAVLG